MDITRNYKYLKTIDADGGNCQHCNKKHLKYFSVLQDVENWNIYNIIW